MDEFCALFNKSSPKRSHLLGTTCIVCGNQLSLTETQWFVQHPQVTTYDQCVLISFDGKGSDDERRLQASNTQWCANDKEGFASVVLPEILAFLSGHSFE